MAYSDDDRCRICGASLDSPCESTCEGRVFMARWKGLEVGCLNVETDTEAAYRMFAEPAPAAVLPTNSQERKDTPIYSGVLRYFPRALAYIAKVSKAGNDKHNPGQPLHWSKGKSNDHGDCVARHLLEVGTVDTDDGLLHSGKLAWRALALLEIELENGEKSA